MKKQLMVLFVLMTVTFSWAGGTKILKPPSACAVASACFASYQGLDGEIHWVQTGSVACNGSECNVGTGYVICDGRKTDCA